MAIASTVHANTNCVTPKYFKDVEKDVNGDAIIDRIDYWPPTYGKTQINGILSGIKASLEQLIRQKNERQLDTWNEKNRHMKNT